MSDQDFYEDDESVEKIRGAFAKGEKGLTARPRDLNQRAASIVGAVAERTEAVEPDDSGWVDTSGWFAQETVVSHGVSTAAVFVVALGFLLVLIVAAITAAMR